MISNRFTGAALALALAVAAPAQAQTNTAALEAERDALEECLGKLPDPQRKLVEAAYAPGVRMNELAARLGRTSMSLYKALHRIRLALMDCTERVLAREGLA